MVAAADGTASLQVLHPGGEQSWFGEAPPYIFDAPTAEFVMWGAYHADGQTYGGVVAPDDKFDTFASHLIAVIPASASIPEPSSLAIVAILLIGACATLARKTAAADVKR